MGRVLTNNTSFQYSIESALGVAGTSWFELEPNTINAFGATSSKVARSPISKNRQRRKGTVVDRDSPVEFDHDLTVSAFIDFIEGFAFVTAKNRDLDLAVTAVGATADEFTVAALSASQADRLEFSATEYATLIYARGFAEAANNGLHQLDADVATSATAIGVTTALADEASPPANAQVELAGLRFLDGATDVTVAYSGTTLTITVNTAAGGIVGFDFADYGLSVGQAVHVGSPDGSGGVTNALQDAAANDTFGYARITAIETDGVAETATLTLDKADTTLQVASPTSPATLDLLFGKFVRNVTVDHADYLERSFHFEAGWENLGSGGGTEYEYAKGNYCDAVSFQLPLTEKATVGFGFVGTDSEPPVAAGSRKTGADSAKRPVATAAFNTSADIARLRVIDTDEGGLSTDFKSLTLTLGNNVTPEKVLGQVGAKFLNTGIFEVGFEAEMLFSNSAVVSRIRDNTTVSLDFTIKNDDGAIHVDFPALTLGDGARNLPVNESVTINTPGEAFEDPTLGTSIGISIFPVVP